MLRTSLCSLVALLSLAALAPADAHAQNVRRIRWMTIDTPCGGAGQSLTSMVEGDTLPSTTMEATTGNDKIIPLAPGALERVVAVQAATGVINDAGLAIKLEAYDASGALLYAATTTVAKGKTSATFVEAKGPGFALGPVTLRKTLIAGVFALEINLLGEGASAIAKAVVTTTNPQAGAPAITTTTSLLGAAIRSQRAFSAPVRFDGDPTGRDYKLDLRVLQPQPDRRPVVLARTTGVFSMESVPQPLPCGGGFALQSQPATADEEAPNCCDHIDLDLDVDP